MLVTGVTSLGYSLGRATLGGVLSTTSPSALEATGSEIAANGVQAEIELTSEQTTNLARFTKKLPAGNTGVAVDTIGDAVLFTAEVPGKFRDRKLFIKNSWTSWAILSLI